MKTTLTAVALILTLSACGSATETPDTERDEAAIRDLIRQAEAFNNAADTLGWVSLFSDDAVYMAPGMAEVTGREDLVEVAEAGFGSYRTDISIEPVELVVAGDWAFARSRISGVATSRTDDALIPVDMKQITIFRRTADGWRIARLINNSNG